MIARPRDVIYELPLKQFGTDCPWDVHTIDQLAEVLGGGTPDTDVIEYWDPPEIPWATPTDITGTEGNDIRTTERSISKAGLKQSTLVPENSVLMTSRATIGAAKINRIPMAINQGFAALCAKDGHSSEYLFHLLHILRPTLVRMGAGTTFLETSRREIRKVQVRVPEPEEQRRIADVLKLADDTIQQAQVELQATRELKRSLLTELLEKGLPGRHSYHVQTKRFAYPKTWTLTKLKNCGSWSAGGTPDREDVGFYEGSIPWVKSGEVNYSTIVETEEHLSEEGVQKTTCGLLPVGTLLVAMYGAGVTRGRVALLGVQASTNQAVATFNGHDEVENEFIYYWFERNYERVRAWAAGSNQDNLSGYLLKNIQIAMPGHREQLEIVKPLKATDSAIRAIEMRVGALGEMKRALLKSLLTGKIRIPEGAIHA